VTFGRQPSEYGVHWRVIGWNGGISTELGSGSFGSSTTADWKMVDLPIRQSGQVFEAVDVVLTPDNQEIALPIGVPLFDPGGDVAVPSAEVEGAPTRSQGRVGLLLRM
jgi:hypothetical protein